MTDDDLWFTEEMARAGRPIGPVTTTSLVREIRRLYALIAEGHRHQIEPKYARTAACGYGARWIWPAPAPAPE